MHSIIHVNDLGKEGWELVSVVRITRGQTGGQTIGYFKRPLNNARLPIEVEVVNDSPINVNAVSSP